MAKTLHVLAALTIVELLSNGVRAESVEVVEPEFSRIRLRAPGLQLRIGKKNFRIAPGLACYWQPGLRSNVALPWEGVAVANHDGRIAKPESLVKSA
jgi:hypothetical protein